MSSTISQPSPTQPAPTPARRFAAAAQTLSALAIFAARRLAFSALALLLIIFLTYWGFALVNGEPALAAAGRAVGETLAYLLRLAQGDLGETQSGTLAFVVLPVVEVLPNLAARSLGLLGTALLFSILIGVPLGAYTAIHRRSRRAFFLILLSLVGISTPSFFAALFLQIAAIQYTRVVGRALVPVGGFGWDLHLVLPMLVLAARPVAQITRMTYVSLLDVFGQDYVRTARGKGLPRSRIFWLHIFRNAGVPILTTIAVSLRFALSSLPVVEVYFGWGGMGQALLASIFDQDADLTIALFLTLGLVFILINLALEIGYRFIDPRLRTAPATIRDQTQRGFNLRSTLAGWISEINLWLRDNAVTEALRSLAARLTGAGRNAALSPAERIAAESEAAYEDTRWRAWRRGLLGNLPLLIGALILTGLLALTLFGPHLAPFSPNTTQNIIIQDGQIRTPPFPPSAVHPWGTDPHGRDMLSLILSGAQQTILLALAVTAVRLLIGFVLGILSGWFAGGRLDNMIQAVNQAVAVFPTLLLAAFLIFIFGIQGGMPTFILALSLVGWGEIMQLVRSETLAIRPRPYIESALAVGQRTTRLLLMHVLPGLAATLISAAALEAGAVLLLLGELGFLGIFLLGGAGTDLGMYSYVPEWGALLSGVRTWTRSYPWTGFYPTAAFLVAVLGFNLLGEGLRRLADEVGLVVNRLFNRYTFALALLIAGGFYWARGNTGELVFFRQQAATFDGGRALAWTQQLTDPALGGRALDSPALPQTAEQIAAAFSGLGLQPAGIESTYFQPVERAFQRLPQAPMLTLDDGGPQPEFGQDFAVYPAATQNQGAAAGEVVYLALGPLADEQLKRLDLAQAVALVPDDGTLDRLSALECRAALVIADDLSDLKRRYTLSAQPAGRGCGQDAPVLFVSERLALRLLDAAGLSQRQLQARLDQLAPVDVLALPTGVHASLDIRGEVVAAQPAANVLGLLPGTSQALDDRLIIVAAQYDAPPLGPDGAVYPAANDNASGMAVLLEAVRTLQESGYQPFKSFLFVAYSGEGLPDLAAAPPVRSYLEAKTGFAGAFTIEAVIYLRGLGQGQEDTLGVWALGNNPLAKQLETAAHLARMQTQRVVGLPSMNIFPPALDRSDPALLQIGLSRLGWDRTARLATDNTAFMRAEDLQSAGEAITLGLMILGR